MRESPETTARTSAAREMISVSAFVPAVVLRRIALRNQWRFLPGAPRCGCASSPPDVAGGERAGVAGFEFDFLRNRGRACCPRAHARRLLVDGPEKRKSIGLNMRFWRKLLRALNARFRQLGPVGAMQKITATRSPRRQNATSFCVIVTHRTGRCWSFAPTSPGPRRDLGMGRGGGLSLAGENESPPFSRLCFSFWPAPQPTKTLQSA